MGDSNASQSRLTVTQDMRRSNNVPSVKPGQMAPDNNQNEPPQPSRTMRLTTDQRPQKVTQVTIPFKSIPVVPPQKGRGADLDLRIEPETRRPLSPVPNSMSHAKVIKNRQMSTLLVPRNTQVISPSELDNFENINERELPILTDNCDDVSTSQLTTSPDPITLNGPPGLLIGEEISGASLTNSRPLALDSRSTNKSLDQSELITTSHPPESQLSSKQ